MTTIQGGVVEVGLDSSKFSAGIADVSKKVDNLAQHVSTAADKAGAGFDGMGNSAGDAAKKVEQETRRIISSIQRQIAQTEAGQRGTAQYYAAIANQRGVNQETLKPYLNQLNEVTKAQNLARASAAALDPQVQKLGMSQKQLAFAMRGVPAQMTDIVVGLASCQRPFMVMIQQGGQLKDMFGGIVPAFKALASYALRMVNPLTLAAAALGGLAYAYYEGSSESDRLNKALISTGNSAGTTTYELTKLAGEIGKTAKAYGTARGAAEALAGSGRFAASQIEPVMKALTYGAEVTGEEVKNLVTEMENIAGKPTEAIIKLNEKYNFLTKDIYDQIKAHEKNKNAQEAARIAFEAYANAMESRKKDIQENLGYIEQGWIHIKNAIKGATDAALGYGRVADPLKEIERLQKDIAEMEGSTNAPNLTEYINASKTKLKALQDEQAQLAKTTAEQAKANQAVKDYIKVDQENEKKKKRKSPEETAYQRLISRIKERIEANELEALTGKALTEAEKMQIKYESELAAGKIKLTQAQKNSTQSLLDELKAIEIKSKISKALSDVEYDHAKTMRLMAVDQRLQLSLIGKSDIAAKKLTATTKILADAEERILKLRKDGVSSEHLEKTIRDYARREADVAEKNVDEQENAKKDPFVGLKRGADNWLAYAQDTARQTEDAFNNAMSGAEDAWVKFVQTGKVSFKSLVNSIIADLARMQFKSIMSPIISSLSGMFGGSGGSAGGGGLQFDANKWFPVPGVAGALALGGPATAGTPYLVGEKGPELFIPSASGNVIPNDRTSGGISITSNPVIHIDSRSDSAYVRQEVERGVKAGNAALVERLERQRRI